MNIRHENEIQLGNVLRVCDVGKAAPKWLDLLAFQTHFFYRIPYYKNV